MKRLSPRFSLLLLSIVLAGSFAPAQADLFSVSPEKEIKLGQQAAAQIEQSPIIVTGPVEEWVQRVGAKLAAVSDPEFKYSFHVIDSPEINAFCLPGGHIYVFTGLRKIVRNDDELAAVLAHEITHAENHHYAKQSKKANTRGSLLTVASILLGLPGIGQAAVGLVDASMSAKYSREHEYEADRDGLARMQKAGFNGEAMVTVLERLATQDNLKSIDRWMSDHPEGKKRVLAIKALLPSAK
jgi:predicted Zn-dependent protease